MTMNNAPIEFAKKYVSKGDCSRAAANYRWLANLSSPMRSPELLTASETRLVFAFSLGAAARPSDLLAIAEHLGDVHGAIYRTVLHQAHLGQDFIAAGGQVISGFLDQRLEAVERHLRQGTVPAPTLSVAASRDRLGEALDEPAAIYKDSNPRNFLVLPDQLPITVDFDDLTLAPFGYDLAKLIVALAMTHGPISARFIGRSLTLYNRAARRHHHAVGRVTPAQLLTWAEIHHVLTSPYQGRNGYTYSWHQMRPTATELQAQPIDEIDEGETPWP